jgi:hypothetical protein
MCINPGALASALANRIESGGAPATESEVRALLGSGCTKEELRLAFERGASRAPSHRFTDALMLLDRL